MLRYSFNLNKEADVIEEAIKNVLKNDIELLIFILMDIRKLELLGLSEVIAVNTMAERKDILRDVADAIIVLAGGVGTFDEPFETLALKQLGLFFKLMIIINTNGYFDEILRMLDKTVVENFMQEENKAMWQVISSTEELPAALEKPVEWHKDRIKFTYIEG